MIKRDCSILLVDKDPEYAALLAQQISDIPGMSVSACLTNGRNAVEYLWSHPVDILITDIDIPGISGLELIAYCCKHKLGCDMIIVSDVKDFDTAMRALRYGVSSYLPKPVPFSQLAEALEVERATVYSNRLYLRMHSPSHYYSHYYDLENAIRATFPIGTSTVFWKEWVSSLLTGPGYLLRISHQEPISEVRNNAFDAYHNLLSQLLPKTVVISLWPEKSRELYILIPKQDSHIRTVESLSEWFGHIIEHKVTLAMEGTIESVDQLIALAAKAQNRNKAIEAACVYIQNHLSEPLTREVLAQQVYLSPSYFAQLFKQVMGICLSDYVTEVRIRHAKTSLAQNISIRKVAATAGFRNVKYFGEIFYQKTGYMPSEYRRAILTGTLKQN